MTLTAPFPYYGGKRRLAPTIWQHLGDPGVYVEPCAGSLACLLARPGGAGPREIVCDLDGGICLAPETRGARCRPALSQDRGCRSG